MYEKSSQYPDLETIYAQCSGPGGLKLAEFMAEKMQLQPGKRLLDVGMNRGYQTCFLAKDYDVFVVGIDPWNDRQDGRPHVDHLMDNAQSWDVADSVLGIQVGVPDTKLSSRSFDYVYSTTALEMIRGNQGEAAYRESLVEIHRLLRPNGIFGLGEPMHFDVEIPHDLAPLVTQGKESWADCFATITETVDAVESVGFKILEAEYVPAARSWWQEFAAYDPFCQEDPKGDPLAIEVDGGRWLSFGYVIAQKPGPPPQN